jgi:hypothetical protein
MPENIFQYLLVYAAGCFACFIILISCIPFREERTKILLLPLLSWVMVIWIVVSILWVERIHWVEKKEIDKLKRKLEQ